MVDNNLLLLTLLYFCLMTYFLQGDLIRPDELSIITSFDQYNPTLDDK